MLNNIPAHNQTVYSYWQALLTDRHTVSALCSKWHSPFTQHCMLRDTENHMCDRCDVYHSNKFTIYSDTCKGTAAVVCNTKLSIDQNNKQQRNFCFV